MNMTDLTAVKVLKSFSCSKIFVSDPGITFGPNINTARTVAMIHVKIILFCNPNPPCYHNYITLTIVCKLTISHDQDNFHLNPRYKKIFNHSKRCR